MLGWIGRKIYGNKILNAAPELISKHISAAEFDHAMGAFIGTLRSDCESGAIKIKEQFAAYKSAGLSVDEAAISLIDGVITSIKARDHGTIPKPLRDRCILAFENVIDCECRQMTGRLRVHPRNGRLAKA